MEYAGESLAKKVARVRLYRRTKEALLHRGVKPADARVIFLPGPEASEVGALRHILGVQPRNVFGIDRDPEACRALREKMPGATAIEGDLASINTVRALKKRFRWCAEFVHLDLMGNLSPAALLEYSVWGLFCAPDGVMAVTYLRGREQKVPAFDSGVPFRSETDLIRSAAAASPLMEGMRHLASIRGEGRKLARLVAADPERAWTHLMALNHLGANEVMARVRAECPDVQGEEFKSLVMANVHAKDETVFTPIGTHAYRAETSPMGVLITQRVRRSVLESDEYTRLRYHLGRDTTSVLPKDPMDELLAEPRKVVDAQDGTRRGPCPILFHVPVPGRLELRRIVALGHPVEGVARDALLGEPALRPGVRAGDREASRLGLQEVRQVVGGTHEVGGLAHAGHPLQKDEGPLLHHLFGASVEIWLLHLFPFLLSAVDQMTLNVK